LMLPRKRRIQIQKGENAKLKVQTGKCGHLSQEQLDDDDRTSSESDCPTRCDIIATIRMYGRVT
jgi:hypothetical protein